MLRFIDIVRPFMFILPEVGYPDRRLLFREKILWTLVALFIFLICSQIPIYGMNKVIGGDPFYWMRAIFASNRGSLMELGISPLVSSSMALQLLSGARIIHYDQSLRSDRELYQGTQKLLTLAITLIQAGGYVLSGVFGDPSEIGLTNCLFIIAQLFLGGLVVVLLDEMLTRGYGISNATNLFLLAHTSEKMISAAISPLSVPTSRGSEYEGAILAFFQLLFTSPSRLGYAFFRTEAPNLTSLITTTVVSIVILYFQGFRIEIPVKYQKVRSMQTSYPVKLFYTGNTPVVLLSPLVANVYFVSQMLYANLRSNFLVNLIGQWQSVSQDS